MAWDQSCTAVLIAALVIILILVIGGACFPPSCWPQRMSPACAPLEPSSSNEQNLTDLGAFAGGPRAMIDNDSIRCNPFDAACVGSDALAEDGFAMSARHTTAANPLGSLETFADIPEGSGSYEVQSDPTSNMLASLPGNVKSQSQVEQMYRDATIAKNMYQSRRSGGGRVPGQARRLGVRGFRHFVDDMMRDAGCYKDPEHRGSAPEMFFNRPVDYITPEEADQLASQMQEQMEGLPPGLSTVLQSY